MTDQPTGTRAPSLGDVARPEIAAARRHLPMVEVDPQTPLTGAEAAVPLIDIFEGRSQLIAYCQMWHPGRPRSSARGSAAEQCEGWTVRTRSGHTAPSEAPQCH